MIRQLHLKGGEKMRNLFSKKNIGNREDVQGYCGTCSFSCTGGCATTCTFSCSSNCTYTCSGKAVW
ncbi:AC3_0185 family rSAM-modified Cys-rich RiPP [Paenibacillus polymyxa]|uniref:AC3_0185 family rSAM-modified Cys-rich RiPP n=1 Tax=Paenibacillus polymyxa TaxID=1406 RepID=UPI003312F9A8